MNSISLTRGEEEKNDKNDVTTVNNIEKTNGLDMEMPVKKVEKENEAENGTINEPIKRAEREEALEAPTSQPALYLRNTIPETAKAVIEFDKGTITLRSRKSKTNFHRIAESL
ncbi:hypothetical protein Tco_0023887, partial [Tanacetum coccineum]